MKRSMNPWTYTLVAVALSTTATPGQTQQRQQVQSQSGDAYAKPSEQDGLRQIATNINAQRSAFFAKRDAAGIASLYTQDASYTQLLPRLSMMTGHNQIQDHFRELFRANATELQYNVTMAQAVSNDTQVVGGDYFLTAAGKRIAGHFVQTLKLEGGTWKISNHVFARPEPVTMQEVSEYR